jgi:hypothetical protein
MPFWKNLFGGAEDDKSHQLPSSMVASEFGEVNVRRKGPSAEILFTILMEPTGAGSEGWQTGVAIDASGSMKGAFGKGLEAGPRGKPPQTLLEDYHRRGWVQLVKQQGETYIIFGNQAEADLVAKGHYVWSRNEIEPLARRMTAYLAANLDADGGTTVIYWACGDGHQIEEIGDLTAEDCELAPFKGPTKLEFGSGTGLTPAVKYFADRFQDAKNGMYIFITDGELHDLEEVKSYTTYLCRQIQAGRRNPLKCVLIGIGSDINEQQMEELDDLETGTNVDIWDHKIAREMRNLIEIFAEVVSENQIVAPTARIFDANGQVVKNYPDGLPAKVSFSMPSASPWFELEVAGKRIRQSIVVPK